MVNFSQQRITYDFFRHRIYAIVPDIMHVVHRLGVESKRISGSVRSWLLHLETTDSSIQTDFINSLNHRETNIDQLLHHAVQSLEQLCGLCKFVECSSMHSHALWVFICRQLYELPTRLYEWSMLDIRDCIDTFIAEQVQITPEHSECPKTQTANRYRLECLQKKLASVSNLFHLGLSCTRSRDEFVQFVDTHLIIDLGAIVRTMCDTYDRLLGHKLPTMSVQSSSTENILVEVYVFLCAQVVPACPSLRNPTTDATYEIQLLRKVLESFVPQKLTSVAAMHNV